MLKVNIPIETDENNDLTPQKNDLPPQINNNQQKVHPSPLPADEDQTVAICMLIPPFERLSLSSL